MSNCVDCSGEDNRERVGVTGNVNPLDCNTQFMQCGNPCRSGPKNSPNCESLPSQIQNFTDQFFGTVVKTEVNGKVVWSLPCNLDIGLPNNPRVPDEGLACYFLRLFRDGIGGLTGPAGAPGKAGINGANTYTVTLQPFAQPSVGNPLTQIVIVPNPSIIEGIGVFIQGSGSYVVTSVSPGGVIFATMTAAAANPVSIVPAGSMVVPVGISVTALVGPQGPPGAPGAPGAPGINGSSISAFNNGTWTAFLDTGGLLPGVADFTPTGSWSPVVFGAQTPGFSVPSAGKYLVNAIFRVGAPVPGAGVIIIALYSTATGIVTWTQQSVSGISSGTVVLVPITAIVSTSGAAGDFLGVQAYTSTPGNYQIAAVGTQISWVRIA